MIITILSIQLIFSQIYTYVVEYTGTGDNQTLYDNIVADGAYDDLIVDYPPGE